MGLPTAAKLISAVLFAAMAWFVAVLYASGLTEGHAPSGLRETSALIGMVCGWSIMGGFVSRPCGRIQAMGTGIRTAFTTALAVLVVFAVAEMLKRSIKGRYDEPMQAVLAVFDLMITQGRNMLTPEILGVLLLGGIVGGAAAHRTGQGR